MLDSADDIFPAALGYLGLDPNSTAPADLERAADLVGKIRPYVRKFHSSEYLSGLGHRRDLLRRRLVGRHHAGAKPCRRGKSDIEIGYAIPKEGAQMFFDNLAIPADAKNVTEAYALIDYLYRPDDRRKEFELSVLRERQSGEPEADRSENSQRQEHLPDDATLMKLFRDHRARSRDPARHQPALDAGEDRTVALPLWVGTSIASGGAATATVPDIRESSLRPPR